MSCVVCFFLLFFPSFPIICMFNQKPNSTFYHFITQFEVLGCFSIYQMRCAYHSSSYGSSSWCFDQFIAKNLGNVDDRYFCSCDDAILYDVFLFYSLGITWTHGMLLQTAAIFLCGPHVVCVLGFVSLTLLLHYPFF
jgi:hypothetical protein